MRVVVRVRIHLDSRFSVDISIRLEFDLIPSFEAGSDSAFHEIPIILKYAFGRHQNADIMFSDLKVRGGGGVVE